MLKLKTLTFEGFRTPLYSASIEFSKELITVIYGDNGSGKTTYLRAINAFLSQDNAYLDSISVQNIVCDYFYDEINEICDEDGDVVEKEIVEENLLGSVRVEKRDGQYDWAAFEQSPLIKTKSLSLGTERGVATQQLRIDAEVILNYFLHSRNRGNLKLITTASNSGVHELAEDMSRYFRTWQVNSNRSKRSELNFSASHVNLQNIKLENIEQILSDRYKTARDFATERIQEALFDTLAISLFGENSIIPDISKADFVNGLKSSRTRLVEALSDNSKNETKNMIISKLKELDNDAGYDAIFEKSQFRVLLFNMMDQLKFEKLLLSSVNTLVDTFNKYLMDGKILKISDDKLYIDADGRELNISDLSSGERHILTFLTLVLFQGRNRNFLIIDEPEISLNIKWQRELMGVLQKLAPDTQIIVASHSPVLAKLNPAYLSELKVRKFQ